MPIIELVDRAFQIYYFLLLARIIMSWVSVPSGPTINVVVRFIDDVTEPYLRIFRSLLPTAGGIDFSPIIGFIVLGIIQGLVNQVLRQSLGV